MSPENNSLVIGSDSLLGRALLVRLTDAGDAVWGTSRRESAEGPRRVRLDLSAATPKLFLPQPVHSAFVCASVTAMQTCEAQPAETRRVNVTNTLRIAEQLLERGTFVQYLSSSAVFDGIQAYPAENARSCATTEYGRQKAEVEARLLELDGGRGQVAICRLSKVIAPAVPVIARIVEALETGNRVEAFSELALSPVSVAYAVDSLLAVARRRLGGIFHFSGERELTYADLARTLAGYLRAPESLVAPVTAADRGIVPLFRPVHPALGMAGTTARLGILPQPLDRAVASLVQQRYREAARA